MGSEVKKLNTVVGCGYIELGGVSYLVHKRFHLSCKGTNQDRQRQACMGYNSDSAAGSDFNVQPQYLYFQCLNCLQNEGRM